MINACQMIRRDSGWVNGPMVDSFRGEYFPYKWKKSLKTETIQLCLQGMLLKKVRLGHFIISPSLKYSLRIYDLALRLRQM